MTVDYEATKVHIVKSDVPLSGASKAKEAEVSNSTFTTRYLLGTGIVNQTERLLNHIPNRCRALITVVGQSSDVVFLCKTGGDAENLQGAIAMAGPYAYEIKGTNELHIGAAPGVSVAIGIVQEFYGDGS